MNAKDGENMAPTFMIVMNDAVCSIQEKKNTLNASIRHQNNMFWFLLLHFYSSSIRIYTNFKSSGRMFCEIFASQFFLRCLLQLI